MSEEKMAVTGTIAGFKPMVMTGCLRIMVDIEPEMANAALQRLGGLLGQGESRHVALAVLAIAETPINTPELVP